MKDKLIIYTDGGSRGNPGPSAIGVTIKFPDKSVREYAEYIGEATNNIAEYKAVIFALRKTKQLLGGKKAAEAVIEINSDSVLIVEQLSGRYKILDKELRELFLEAWNLKLDFEKVDFKLIPREKNKKADKLVNQALDGNQKKQGRLL